MEHSTAWESAFLTASGAQLQSGSWGRPCPHLPSGPQFCSPEQGRDPTSRLEHGGHGTLWGDTDPGLDRLRFLISSQLFLLVTSVKMYSFNLTIKV